MSKQTNTLLILMDQWGGKRIGAAGNEFIQTPTLDQLAKKQFATVYFLYPQALLKFVF